MEGSLIGGLSLSPGRHLSFLSISHLILISLWVSLCSSRSFHHKHHFFLFAATPFHFSFLRAAPPFFSPPVLPALFSSTTFRRVVADIFLLFQLRVSSFTFHFQMKKEGLHFWSSVNVWEWDKKRQYSMRACGQSDS